MEPGMGGSDPVVRRPRFPPNYGIPETDEGSLPWTWASERLESTRNYWLGTTRPDGSPHAMPVWAIWLDGALVFSTSPDSRKGRNLARDPRFVIGVERDDDVIVLEGAVAEIPLDETIADVYEA
jgi:nitroimidazol reductase NimA-like FMN-containing flavoprotein (pyridoxamine 5'-phosphate oxidase superfamily)